MSSILHREDSSGLLPPNHSNQSSPSQATSASHRHPSIPVFYDQNQRNKCVDESVSKEQLLMMGMYRLTPEQEVIYQSFVSMLSSFETIDVVS